MKTTARESRMLPTVSRWGACWAFLALILLTGQPLLGAVCVPGAAERQQAESSCCGCEGACPMPCESCRAAPESEMPLGDPAPFSPRQVEAPPLGILSALSVDVEVPSSSDASMDMGPEARPPNALLLNEVFLC